MANTIPYLEIAQHMLLLLLLLPLCLLQGCSIQLWACLSKAADTAAAA
jgi:hypothetical protein